MHYVPLEAPEDIDKTMAWLREHDATEVPRIIRNANAFVARSLLRPGRDVAAALAAGRDNPCALPPPEGAGPRSLRWTHAAARDGSRHDAETMRRVVACIVDPAVANAP